jgi:methylated-DNA-protein-cysteine methyltransferase-like protein
MRISPSYRRIYAVVARIPRGRVATYGQVAWLAGLGEHARQVGYALYNTPDDVVIPWHRVINAKGEVSLRKMPGCDRYQQALLEDEGVVFDLKGRVSLERFGWKPRTQKRKTQPPGRARKRSAR